jgi:hypothetical protein
MVRNREEKEVTLDECKKPVQIVAKQKSETIYK